jgi:murein L,D-transpeptidase YcbB/YkuD
MAIDGRKAGGFIIAAVIATGTPATVQVRAETTPAATTAPAPSVTMQPAPGPAEGAQTAPTDIAPNAPPAGEKSASSEIPATPLTPPTSAQATVTPASLALDMGAAIGRIAAETKADKRNSDAASKFYAERQGNPVWMTAAGPTAGAIALVAEIERAEDWGLVARRYAVPALDGLKGGGATPFDLADAEARLTLAALAYARHARSGQVEPTALTKFLDRQPKAFDASGALASLASAADPAAALVAFHPTHQQFVKLREHLLALRQGSGAQKEPEVERIPAGPALKPGMTHPHVAVLRRRLLPASIEAATASGKEAVYDPALVEAAREWQRKSGLSPVDGVIGAGSRAVLNGDQTDAGVASVDGIVANMEQWRWMPDDLGRFHVIVNVPEYTVRVVRDGAVVHAEKVIVGKTNTQTPIFSDEMEQVIFQPFWGVPESIKMNEVLPSLRGSRGVLAKYNLRLQLGGRDVDPNAIDWSRTDIRRFHVYQPPGKGNVLGVVKFWLPNKHDVYLHDTPSKSLFQTSVRTYSHGCVRVQDPVKLAEILLTEDGRMPATRVASLATPNAPQNNQINLQRRIPVHFVYFTAAVDGAGKLKTFKDIYGHQERISLGLAGKMHLVKPVPEPKKNESVGGAVAQLSEINKPTPSVPYKQPEWARRAFSGGSSGFGDSGN